MKMKMKKFSMMRTVGALGGGVAAGAVKSLMPSDNSDTTNALIVGAIGAAASAFVGGEIFEGVGAGMLGVAGAQLTSGMFDSETASTTSGVGLIPANHAVMGVGRPRAWVNSRIRGTEDSEIPTGKNNVI